MAACGSGGEDTGSGNPGNPGGGGGPGAGALELLDDPLEEL